MVLTRLRSRYGSATFVADEMNDSRFVSRQFAPHHRQALKKPNEPSVPRLARRAPAGYQPPPRPPRTHQPSARPPPTHHNYALFPLPLPPPPLIQNPPRYQAVHQPPVSRQVIVGPIERVEPRGRQVSVTPALPGAWIRSPRTSSGNSHPGAGPASAFEHSVPHQPLQFNVRQPPIRPSDPYLLHRPSHLHDIAPNNPTRQLPIHRQQQNAQRSHRNDVSTNSHKTKQTMYEPGPNAPKHTGLGRKSRSPHRSARAERPPKPERRVHTVNSKCYILNCGSSQDGVMLML